ncbi:hypothetical protein BDY17DRAFT_246183 [Neohortaea acidophila]|uniref:Uncharacterized protein n=1 Tax=Neohortaea acidophila TaxID=245834 RepID=A0A6A6Q2U1_9PEZI|nr:uncharacterized protein BDY17DRAFT_246183 [Neohortaea acidophila]KAF2486818.1 hypothetical protein BDY17DRAFT_246183 [Neohortaea acidophila]
MRSTNGVPVSSPGSRLPLPVLKRPATSHQRSVTLPQASSATPQSDRMSIDEVSADNGDSRPRHYFTPKSAPADWSSLRNRNPSSIPTPSNIKRIYPDRKYTPILVAARSTIQPASVEVDDGVGLDEDEVEVANSQALPTFGSSPLPSDSLQVQEGPTPRRSFSIGDLLSGGPQPLWRRPSQKKAKGPPSKLVRRRSQRIVSAPQQSMGNTLGIGSGADGERPAKRRDLTNPLLTPRSIYSSSSSNPPAERDTPQEIQLNLSSKISPQSIARSPSQSPSADAVLSHAWSTPPLDQNRLPSATGVSGATRHSQLSATHSEAASFADSDSEYRSIGDASTDYQSDTVFNSYNTRTTRSSSGKRGPHIEKIFEDSPPALNSARSTKLQDLLQEGALAENGRRYRHSTIEEEGSITSTPVRSLRTNSVMSTPSARPGAVPLAFTSSPPMMQIMPDPDEIDWDASEDESNAVQGHEGLGLRTNAHDAYPVNPQFRFGATLQEPHGLDSTPNRLLGAHGERSNPFDWSEVQPSPSHNTSPQRPRTVHGKKNAEGRGSRAVGRRAPSGIHARSHSVPVAPEASGRRTNVAANRFGTWGVGSKVVTEDWNDDFTFDDAPPPEAPSGSNDGRGEGERDDDAERNMFVPRSIREQQENVVANITLLREWGLLIEELKVLRIRASALGMLEGRYAREWEEVDAMIELADQETEEKTLEPRRSPPSSPSFDHSAFDEQFAPAPTRAPATAPPPTITAPASEATPSAIPPHHSSEILTRPRKDSEAVAQSIIQALQTKRTAPGPSTSQAKKVPFDTATLRHIVPYVHGLARKVKEALRETEDLRTSPQRPGSVARWGLLGGEEGVVPFPSPFAARSRREEAFTDHDGGEEMDFEDEEMDDGERGAAADVELARRVQRMNLPRG